MATMKGGSISGAGVTIPLDGNEYEGVRFEHCIFVYAATARVKFTNCQFFNCKVDLQGLARQKAGHMIARYEADPKLIEDIYDL